jgi:hypothetical protein
MDSFSVDEEVVDIVDNDWRVDFTMMDEMKCIYDCFELSVVCYEWL